MDNRYHENSPLKIAFFLDGGEGGGIVEFIRQLTSSMDTDSFILIGIFIGFGNSYTVLHTLFNHTVVLTNKRLVNYKSTTGRLQRIKLNIEKMFIAANSLLRLTQVLRKEKIDIVDVSYYPHHVLAGAACRVTKTPCIWHWHSAKVTSRKNSFLLAIAIRHFCTAILPVSKFVEQSLPSASLSKSTVVYNAVDIEEIQIHQQQGYLRQLAKAAPGDHLIAMVGTMIPLKGHQYFIEAADMVLRTYPNAKFLIIGKETEAHRMRFDFENKMKEKVKALNRDKDILFLGHVPNASQYIIDCTIVCMPSTPYGNLQGEAFGLSIAAAMAAGVAVIATDCGGLPEVIEQKVTGLLVPPKDSTALAEAIELLLSNKSLRDRLTVAGKEAIKRKFGMEKQIEHMQSIYKKVTNRKIIPAKSIASL